MWREEARVQEMHPQTDRRWGCPARLSARTAVLWWASLAIVTAAGNLAAGTGSIRPEEALAIVTRPEGEVWVKERRNRRSWPARTLQAVGEGATLELGQGAQLNLLCRDGGVLELEESGVLTVRRCREARRRAPGRFAALVPDGGRLKIFADSLTLEGETRDDKPDYGLRPVLLAPRCPLEEAHRLGCTRMSKPPPAIRWVAVPDADRYLLRLSGFVDQEVAAGELACEDGGEVVPHRICSLRWPDGWQLVPGSKVFLQIEARTGLFDKVSSEKTKIELLSGDEAVGVGRELAELAGLGLDPTTRDLFEASLHAERGFVNQARAALEKAAGLSPGAVLRVALGDACRRVDLLYPALRQYEKALDQLDADADQPAVRAAANLGLGWVHHLWGSSELALVHARTALDLYRQLGLPDEEEAARLLERILRIRSAAETARATGEEPLP